MKKVLSIVLAIAMIASMATVAFANPVTLTALGSQTIDVNGVYADGEKVGNYKVIVAWADMEFTYTTNATEWNVDTHMWDVTEEAAWAGAGTITVTNHSDVKVTASAAYAAVEGGNTAMAFTNNHAEGAAPAVSASADAVSAAPAATIGATVSAGTITESGKIGTITVTIA